MRRILIPLGAVCKYMFLCRCLVDIGGWLGIVQGHLQKCISDHMLSTHKKRTAYGVQLHLVTLETPPLQLGLCTGTWSSIRHLCLLQGIVSSSNPSLFPMISMEYDYTYIISWQYPSAFLWAFPGLGGSRTILKLDGNIYWQQHDVGLLLHCLYTQHGHAICFILKGNLKKWPSLKRSLLVWISSSQMPSILWGWACRRQKTVLKTEIK